MKRRALIIYCDNTPSDPLVGPPFDNSNYRNFLQSKLGGEWLGREIKSLNNPTSLEVSEAVNGFMSNADYTFTIFTGHGFINTDDGMHQYVELLDTETPIRNLRTSADRQTLIVDACRGYISPSQPLRKYFSDLSERIEDSDISTRQVFDNAVMRADLGWTILYATNRNASALDTNSGAAYLLSLLESAHIWKDASKRSTVLNLKDAHNYSIELLNSNFDVKQVPVMNREKRIHYFPFAVKTNLIKD